MAVQRDYNKPLQEEEPYLVQVSFTSPLTMSMMADFVRIDSRATYRSQGYTLPPIGMVIPSQSPIEVILLEVGGSLPYRLS